MTTITWESESGLTLPGRVYSVERGPERYSVTVADYSGIEQRGIERAKTCPVKGFETCEGGAIQGIGYWKHDTRGAIIYATHKLMQRDVKVTEFTWGQQDLVEGHYLQTTSNVDQSRTTGTPMASRKSGRSKPRAAPGSKKSASRATTSSRRTPSKCAAIRSETAPPAVCSAS